MFRLCVAALAFTGGGVTPAAAQQAFRPATWHVSGQVMRGTRKAPVPVPGTWAVLHRVGQDKAAPMDSVRTGPDGSYAFNYKPFGDTSAVYFVSSSYEGVAYFTDPLRLPDVRGDDAQITVFDTSYARDIIQVAGHHVIVGAPEADGNRQVGEVFDLQNDSTVTVVGSEASPVWVTHLPHGVVNFQLNQNGEIPAAAVLRRGDSLALYAPISPGLRQLAVTYQLPPAAFPLSIPLERATSVLEVMVQEPLAKVSGPRLLEQAPTTLDGRNFRRFLAQDLPASAVLGIDVPSSPDRNRNWVITILAIVGAGLVVGAIVAASRRRPVGSPTTVVRAPVEAARRAESPAETLMREIAALDLAFEARASRAKPPTESERLDYERARADLKARLADVLATPAGRT